MQVNGGSKIRNLMSIALKGFLEHGAVVWSGAGPAINKTISCAEILKRRHKSYQITKICFRKTEEFWDPILTDLDQIVVEREEPVIHILLSREPLDSNEPGYQDPSQKNPSLRAGQSGNQSSRHQSTLHSKKRSIRGSSERFHAPREHSGQKPFSKPEQRSQGERH